MAASDQPPVSDQTPPKRSRQPPQLTGAAIAAPASVKQENFATPDEARSARAAVPSAAIYVLNGFFQNCGDAYAKSDAKPVIGDLNELAEWDVFCRRSGWSGGAAIHIDTGMNRLGLTVTEAEGLIPRINAGDHGITLVMSHLACAEIAEHLRARNAECTKGPPVGRRSIALAPAPASPAAKYRATAGAWLSTAPVTYTWQWIWAALGLSRSNQARVSAVNAATLMFRPMTTIFLTRSGRAMATTADSASSTPRSFRLASHGAP